MALYEYFCPTCKTQFEQRRPMSEAQSPAVCAQGHAAERKLSVFAVGGGSAPVMDLPMGGGGCCGGGGCACASRN